MGTIGPAFAARQQIRRSVAAMTGRPGDPRADGYDPLAALPALVALRVAVTHAARDAASRAREDGRSWADIGERLGFADDPARRVTPVAERAFLYVASGLGTGPSFTWRCPSCGKLISDRGPETGGPAEAEQGHADGCDRLAATVAAWDASWDEGSEGDE